MSGERILMPAGPIERTAPAPQNLQVESSEPTNAKLKNRLPIPRVFAVLAFTAALGIFAGACDEENQAETVPPTATSAATISPTEKPTQLVTPIRTQTPEAKPSQSPTATSLSTPEFPTPELLNLDFLNIPSTDLSGEDSLADLMTDLDTNKGPIESKDYLLKEGGRSPEEPRINFEVVIKRPGGLWSKGDEAEFEQKARVFLKWFASIRNLSGDDCLHLEFSRRPRDDTMLYTNPDTGYVIRRSMPCPESSEK